MSSSLNIAIETEVRQYLDVIDKLRSCDLESCNIDLPRIVVCGDQSSGKSSVLEQLSGINFPKGSGLVTRCATEVILKKIPENEEWKACVYTTLNAEKIEVSEPNQLGQKIQELTESLCAPGSLSTERILIEVESPDVPDLTVIDTPGIVRTKTNEQADDQFKEQVYSLIKNYLRNERTIILTVIPCNVNIATVEALELAAEADPKGIRTIGVLTKPDLIDNGTEGDVVKILRNKMKPLKLGYVLVKNRGQKEVEQGLSLRKSKMNAMHFFKTNAVYQEFLNQGHSNKFGTDSLASRLTSILVDRIKDVLPSIEKEILDMKSKVRQQWLELGGSESFKERTESELVTELNNLILQFCNFLRNSSEGSYRANDPFEVRFRSRILELINSFSEKVRDTRPNFEEEEYVEELIEKRKFSKGRELPGFLPFNLFREMCQEYSNEVVAFAENLLDSTKKLTLEIVVHELKESKALRRFPKFVNWVKKNAINCVNILGKESEEQLRFLLKQQENPFTLNEEFSKQISDMEAAWFVDAITKELLEKGQDSGRTDILFNRHKIQDIVVTGLKKAHEVHNTDFREMRMLAYCLKTYWDIDIVRLIDNVSRCIDGSFINRFSGRLQKQLVSDLYSNSQILMEDKKLVSERATLISQLRLLEEGYNVLEEGLTL